ncbi:MAG: ribose-phosphate pyrophosphokinase, partial [Muribaculaceae bacterium]|nr:ribose-phosphate pyrophosphokinase [Muribaculaceae bacterium]
HPVMSDPATDRVVSSGLTEIIFTDSIPYVRENSKATVLPVAKLFADTIRRIHNNQSISSQYLFK